MRLLPIMQRILLWYTLKNLRNKLNKKHAAMHAYTQNGEEDTVLRNDLRG